MSISYEHWTSVEEERISQLLSEAVEPDYARFIKRTVPTALPILGVRAATLRKLSGEIANNGPVRSYLDASPPEQYEKVFLYGMVLGVSRIPFAELLEYTCSFLPRIENWAVCDMTAGGLKQMLMEEHRQTGFDFACVCVQTGVPWSYRFGLILLFRFFLSDTSIDKILALLEQVQCVPYEHYYAKMGTAWFLSEAYLHYPQKILELVDRGTLSNWVVQKGLQKIIESNRVSEEEKEFIRWKKKQIRNQTYPS